MKKLMLSCIIGISLSIATYSQNIQAEFHALIGFEAGMADKYTSNGPQPIGLAIQLQYQMIFKKVGFMLSYENVDRNPSLSKLNTSTAIAALDGQNKADRIMLYFVGRSTKIEEKLFVDFRFGIGKLLYPSSSFYFNFPPIDQLNAMANGFMFGAGIKTQYRFASHWGVLLDFNFSLLPYTYKATKEHIWLGSSEITRSSYAFNYGIALGISYSLIK